MTKLNIDTLAAQYTAAPDRPAKPDLEDRGDGLATLASLVAVQKWALGRWPNHIKPRDGGATLRACQEVATGIGAYQAGGDGQVADYRMLDDLATSITRATQAAAWLLSRGEEK